MTENHEYNIPEQGASNWHVPINDNFETLDTEVEIRDYASNRENYAPKRGAKFLAVDSGAVHIGDGSSWTRIGTIGDRKGGDASPSVYVDPSKGHSGIQDAIDSTDDDIVIELKPGGSYYGDGLVLRDGVTIEGGNHRNTVIGLRSNTDDDLITHTNPHEDNLRRCIVRDVTFRGNAANNDRGNLVYAALYDCRFENVRFTQAPERALWLNSSSASTDDNVFRDCRFDHNGGSFSSPRGGEFAVSVGLSKQDYGSAGVTTFDRCWVGNNNGGGFRIRGNTNVVTNCKFFGNSGPLVYIDNGDHCRVTNCDVSGSTTGTDRAIVARATANCRRPMIFDNFFWFDFQEAAIHLEASGGDMIGALVRDNVIDSSRADTATPSHAIDADVQNGGSFTKCSIMGNVALGPYSSSPIGRLPGKWTTANNVY